MPKHTLVHGHARHKPRGGYAIIRPHARLVPAETEGRYVPRPVACSNCDSPRLVYDPASGETYCGRCGFVMNKTEFVSHRPYMNVEKDTGKEARGYGPPMTILVPDRGLSTDIGGVCDAAGRLLSREQAAQFRRLRILNRREY